MTSVVEPGRVRRAIRRRIERITCGLGNQVECCLCGWKGRHFLSGGLAFEAGRKCAGCGANERYRFLAKYLEDKTDFASGPHQLLDFAPNRPFQRFCAKYSNVQATTTDLFRDDVDLKMDITQMSVPDGCYSIIVCFHVLEHVRDDAAAMSELFRVLRPGGTAYVQVPVRGEVTFEDPHADPGDYERLFGQCDHVRFYGMDVRDRLVNAGFVVKTVSPSESFDAGTVRRFGLGVKCHPTFVCRRN